MAGRIGINENYMSARNSMEKKLSFFSPELHTRINSLDPISKSSLYAEINSSSKNAGRGESRRDTMIKTATNWLDKRDQQLDKRAQELRTTYGLPEKTVGWLRTLPVKVSEKIIAVSLANPDSPNSREIWGKPTLPTTTESKEKTSIQIAQPQQAAVNVQKVKVVNGIPIKESLYDLLTPEEQTKIQTTASSLLSPEKSSQDILFAMCGINRTQVSARQVTTPAEIAAQRSKTVEDEFGEFINFEEKIAVTEPAVVKPMVMVKQDAPLQRRTNHTPAPTIHPDALAPAVPPTILTDNQIHFSSNPPPTGQVAQPIIQVAGTGTDKIEQPTAEGAAKGPDIIENEATFDGWDLPDDLSSLDELLAISQQETTQVSVASVPVSQKEIESRQMSTPVEIAANIPKPMEEESVVGGNSPTPGLPEQAKPVVEQIIMSSAEQQPPALATSDGQISGQDVAAGQTIPGDEVESTIDLIASFASNARYGQSQTTSDFQKWAFTNLFNGKSYNIPVSRLSARQVAFLNKNGLIKGNEAIVNQKTFRSLNINQQGQFDGIRGSVTSEIAIEFIKQTQEQGVQTRIDTRALIQDLMAMGNSDRDKRNA